jgi:hypothetical protein
MNWENIKAKLAGSMRSWTIWFNAILLSLIEGLPMLQESLPQLQVYLPPGIYTNLTMVLIIGNILLRFRTNTGLQHK